ncbi:MAG: TetR family transcriptional regulator [Acidimicrobiia bacterium]|nr:TetR family transcriptional regulator [Acidimicrobiia bacterium]
MVTRAEHRRTTLLKLSAATTEAFEELGSAATIDDIAERAGVSRRTVFRYVDSKEDLAYIHPVLWLEIFDDAVAEVADRPVRERLLHAAERISRHIGSDPEPVKRAMAVAVADPLLRGQVVANQRWIARLAEEILDGDEDDEAVFRARVLASAAMGVIDAALTRWYASPPDVQLVDIVGAGLDYLAPIFD